jgi:broad specificity phosphatase PhoE
MKKIIPLLILFTLLLSCKTTTTPVVEKVITDPDATTFYLIRHAEKVDSDGLDPDLSKAGKERVVRYIDYFKTIKLDSIYTTNFKRTSQTANPIALTKGIEPIIYNPNKIDFINFIKKHKGQTVLIVGHSNTTPKFVNKLIGSMKYSQILEGNYANIYKVIITKEGTFDELLKNDVEINSKKKK